MRYILSLEDCNQAFIHHSVPLVTDLLETCVDEVLRVSVPMVTPEEVGPIGAHSSTVAEETLSLTGELIYANTVRRCTSWPEVMHVFTSYYSISIYRGCCSTQATGDRKHSSACSIQIKHQPQHEQPGQFSHPEDHTNSLRTRLFVNDVCAVCFPRY